MRGVKSTVQILKIAQNPGCIAVFGNDSLYSYFEMLFLETTESVLSFVYNIFSCLLVQMGADSVESILSSLLF